MGDVVSQSKASQVMRWPHLAALAAGSEVTAWRGGGQGGASWLRAAMERDRLSQRGDFVPLFKRCTWQFTCRKWQPTPALLPGKFHGWRNLVGYSPRGHKESDMTERLPFHFSTKPFLVFLTVDKF